MLKLERLQHIEYINPFVAKMVGIPAHLIKKEEVNFDDIELHLDIF